MELVLGPHRFDLRAGVVVLATVEMGDEVDATVAATSAPSSPSLASGFAPHGGLAAALTDAEGLVAAGADAVELDECATGHRDAPDGATGSDAMACTVAAMTARLSVPVGVRTADAVTAMACLDAGATLLALPAGAIDRCLADTAFVGAIEANRAAIMSGEQSASDATAPAGDAAASPATTPDDFAVQLSVAAAHAREAGLPSERVLVDLSAPATAAQLALVVNAVDRLVRDGQLVAVGGWDHGNPERALALTSLMISQGAHVLRSRSPRLVRRVARVVDALSTTSRPAVRRPSAPQPRGE